MEHLSTSRLTMPKRYPKIEANKNPWILNGKQIKWFSLSRHFADHISILCFTNSKQHLPPHIHTTKAPQTQPELTTSHWQGRDKLVSALCSGYAGLPMCEGRENNYHTFVQQRMLHGLWKFLRNTASSTRKLDWNYMMCRWRHPSKCRGTIRPKTWWGRRESVTLTTPL
jgi:hypothetical protein